MATTKRVTPGREGYKILFSENTVIMNHKFAAAAGKYGTKEYKLMMDIRHDFPGMKEVEVSGRVQTTAKTNHRLTYDNMKKYIEVQENAETLKEVFESVKALSKTAPSPYKYVSDWFKEQFPNYKDTLVYDNGNLTVAPEKEREKPNYKVKMGKTA